MSKKKREAREAAEAAIQKSLEQLVADVAALRARTIALEDRVLYDGRKNNVVANASGLPP